MCTAVSSANTIRKLTQVVRRNADDLRDVAADNGFQDWHTECEIAILDIENLVHYRGSIAKAPVNNALIRGKRYTQWWIAETSYSMVKRTQDSVPRSWVWSRQFREIVLLFALNTSRNSPRHYDRTPVPHFQ